MKLSVIRHVRFWKPTLDCVGCGACCKRLAGAYTPDQFGGRSPKEELITQGLLSGVLTVDWWEGDTEPEGELDRVLFIRPPHKDKVGRLEDPAWGGECVHLTESGCKLDFGNRPNQCRALKPKKNHTCSGIDKKEVAQLWRPFQGVIESALATVRKSRNESGL